MISFLSPKGRNVFQTRLFFLVDVMTSQGIVRIGEKYLSAIPKGDHHEREIQSVSLR